MRPLTAYDLIRIWEFGLSRHPIDRSLMILAVAMPEKTIKELATLSIGTRDGYLLTIREQIFGPKLESVIECPECSEQLEFVLNILDIRKPDDFGENVSELEVKQGDYKIRFRPPNSLDLAEIVGQNNASEARKQLIQRCILNAKRKERRISPKKLPKKILETIEQKLGETEVLAEINLSLNCASCNRKWKMVFDISAFLWTEICALTQRLLQEVHILARTYGWSETDILAMSATRRYLYLQMVS